MMGSRVELYELRIDSAEFSPDIYLSPTRIPEVTLTIATVHDISDREKSKLEARGCVECHTTAVESIFKFVPEGILAFTENLGLFSQNQPLDDIAGTYSTKLSYTENQSKEIVIEGVRKRLGAGTYSKKLHSNNIIRIQNKDNGQR
jgi:hypothetical protein